MYGQQYNPFYGLPTMAPYQQRLAQLEQQQLPMTQQQQPPVQALQQPQSAPMLRGRVVASIEEARASQVDFDGNPTYFVCPGERKIYAKSIDMCGLPVFLTYKLCMDEEAKTEQSISNQEFAKRLETLEAKVKELSDGYNAAITNGQ